MKKRTLLEEILILNEEISNDYDIDLGNALFNITKPNVDPKLRPLYKSKLADILINYGYDINEINNILQDADNEYFNRLKSYIKYTENHPKSENTDLDSPLKTFLKSLDQIDNINTSLNKVGSSISNLWKKTPMYMRLIKDITDSK
mgnify:CR=1 FL=1